jgi:hypothetical protein
LNADRWLHGLDRVWKRGLLGARLVLGPGCKPSEELRVAQEVGCLLQLLHPLRRAFLRRSTSIGKAQTSAECRSVEGERYAAEIVGGERHVDQQRSKRWRPVRQDDRVRKCNLGRAGAVPGILQGAE